MKAKPMTFLLTILTLYLCFTAALYLFQRPLTYPAPQTRYTPAQAGIHGSRLSILWLYDDGSRPAPG